MGLQHPCCCKSHRPLGRSRDLVSELGKKIRRTSCRLPGLWFCTYLTSLWGIAQSLQQLPTMAPKSSASAAAPKRKASSSDKHSDGNRAKKAKTVLRPKHQKVDEDDGVASDSDGSGFSDSGDGGVELNQEKPSRTPGSFNKENGKTFGTPVDKCLSPRPTYVWRVPPLTLF